MKYLYCVMIPLGGGDRVYELAVCETVEMACEVVRILLTADPSRYAQVSIVVRPL